VPSFLDNFDQAAVGAFGSSLTGFANSANELIAKGGLSGLGDYGSQAFSFGLNEISAGRAYQRQKNLARFTALHGPRMQVEGLRRAGLNPILAATGGWRGSAVPSAPQAAPSQSHKTSAARMEAATRRGLMLAQLQAMKASAAKDMATAGAQDAQAERTRAESAVVQPRLAIDQSDLARREKLTTAQVRQVDQQAQKLEMEIMQMEPLAELYDAPVGSAWKQLLEFTPLISAVGFGLLMRGRGGSLRPIAQAWRSLPPALKSKMFSFWKRRGILGKSVKMSDAEKMLARANRLGPAKYPLGKIPKRNRREVPIAPEWR
jgi:hypothetical protein